RATAAKVSALLLLPVLGLALVWPRRGWPSLGQFFDGLTAFGVTAVGAFFAFRIAEPYAFLGPAVWGLRLNPQWLTDKAYQVQVSSGTIDVPFMIQWAGTPAYTFVVQNVVQWAMGRALGITCLVGLDVGPCVQRRRVRRAAFAPASVGLDLREYPGRRDAGNRALGRPAAAGAAGRGARQVPLRRVSAVRPRDARQANQARRRSRSEPV